MSTLDKPMIALVHINTTVLPPREKLAWGKPNGGELSGDGSRIRPRA